MIETETKQDQSPI